MTENVHINQGLPHWWFSCKCGTVESGIFSPFLILHAVLNTFALLLLHFTVLNLVLNIAITYSPLSIKQACSLSPSPFALSVLGLYCSTVEPPYSKAYCTSRNQYYSRTFIYIAMSTETRNRLLYQVTWKLRQEFESCLLFHKFRYTQSNHHSVGLEMLIASVQFSCLFVQFSKLDHHLASCFTWSQCGLGKEPRFLY